MGGVSCLNLRVQINSFVAISLFCDKFLREFLQNVPAKSGFLQMCLADNLPDTADCGSLAENLDISPLIRLKLHWSVKFRSNFIKSSKKNSSFTVKIAKIRMKWKMNLFISAKIVTTFLLEFWDLSGAKECESCRSRKALQNDYLIAKIGVDTAENEPL